MTIGERIRAQDLTVLESFRSPTGTAYSFS